MMKRANLCMMVHFNINIKIFESIHKIIYQINNNWKERKSPCSCCRFTCTHVSCYRTIHEPEPNLMLYSIPEAYCREYTYYSSNRTSPPYSWQKIQKMRRYSPCGNVSAFNGIVNRNAFPRGPEQDWHYCC
ncbi:hypothetical protein XENORESO_017922 [Xenotaenia resolanae]|uniref:Uncharacterized protein n=1 Tax=Xenotaenia resolanae TaxID=208358 RepID=A0ABV0WCZ2_9TELE